MPGTEQSWKQRRKHGTQEEQEGPEEDSPSSASSETAVQESEEEDLGLESHPDESKKFKLPVRKLFRFAEREDYILMIIGAIAAALNGAIMPLFAIVFGELLDSFQATDFTDELNRFSLYFLLLGE